MTHSYREHVRGEGSRSVRKALLALLAAIVVALTCSCASQPGQSASAQSHEGELESRVQETLAKMTTEQKVAQLFIVSPGSLDGLVSEGADPLEAYPVGGFIYFGYDLENPDQTRALLAETQGRFRSSTGLPGFLSVDEEGGEVTRVAGNDAFGIQDVGPVSAIGATGDAERAGKAAKYIGDYLVDLGFNVDFAPVADLASGEDDVMSSRSFGPDPNVTAAMVSAQIEGFSDAGILCSAKHFPGIGGVVGDSHEESVVNMKSLGEYRKTALVPFEAAIKADVPFIMVGHVETPAITGNDAPASISSLWLTDVLRKDMGYEGVIITDSLVMDAVDERYSQAELGVLAIEAGADMLLHPSDFGAMYQGVLGAVNSGRISQERLDASVERILRVKLEKL